MEQFLRSQTRHLLLNYDRGRNQPAGVVGRGHGRCSGGPGADPHSPSAGGKCCWPERRRPHPPRSSSPQILTTQMALNDDDGIATQIKRKKTAREAARGGQFTLRTSL